MLFLVDTQSRVIRALDSMGGKFPAELRALQSYFAHEWKEKRPSTTPGAWSVRESDASVPSQGRNQPNVACSWPCLRVAFSPAAILISRSRIATAFVVEWLWISCESALFDRLYSMFGPNFCGRVARVLCPSARAAFRSLWPRRRAKGLARARLTLIREPWASCFVF